MLLLFAMLLPLPPPPPLPLPLLLATGMLALSCQGSCGCLPCWPLLLEWRAGVADQRQGGEATSEPRQGREVTYLPNRNLAGLGLQERYSAALEMAPAEAAAAPQRAVYHANRGACHLKLEQWAEAAQVGGWAGGGPCGGSSWNVLSCPASEAAAVG